MNADSNLFGLDFESYLQIDEHNRSVSLKFLKDDLVHFKMICEMYVDMFTGLDRESLTDKAKHVSFFMFGNSFVNQVKSVSNIISGHLGDANIFARSTMEAVKYAAFLRERPENGDTYIEGSDLDSNRLFEKAFNDWWREKGRSLFKEEWPLIFGSYKLASLWGPHANFASTSRRHQFLKGDGGVHLKLWFHDPIGDESGLALLLQQLYWHMGVHTSAIDWWLSKSGLKFSLSIERLKYWEYCKNARINCALKHQPFLEKHIGKR